MPFSIPSALSTKIAIEAELFKPAKFCYQEEWASKLNQLQRVGYNGKMLVIGKEVFTVYTFTDGFVTDTYKDSLAKYLDMPLGQIIHEIA